MDLFVLDKLILSELLGFGCICGVPIGGISLLAIIGVTIAKYFEAKNKKKVKR